MNNSHALSTPVSTQLLHGIYQYLIDHKHHDIFNQLQAETHVEYDAALIHHTDNFLLNAVSQYNDANNSFSGTAVTIQQQYINTIKSDIYGATNRSTPISRQIQQYQPHTANILAIKLIQYNHQLYTITGSVDKTVVVYDIVNNVIICTIQLQAPVLGVDYNSITKLALIGCMNGHSYIVDIHNQYNTNDNHILVHNTHHNKYIVSCKLSNDGKYYATGSHDMTVKIYSFDSSTYASQHIITIPFNTAVESIEYFIDQYKLFISTRENNFIYICDIQQHISFSAQPVTVPYTQLSRYNMNVSGDLHVSFTALHLSISPNGKLLAVATDKHRIIIFTTAMAQDNNVQHHNTNQSHTDLLNSSIGLQYCNLYDIVNDGYSTPRITWSDDNRYIYVTSQHEHSIVGYDVTTAQRVSTLTGHQSIVRDVTYTVYNDQSILASCSYDRSVRLWSNQTISL